MAWVCDQDAYACSGQKCSAQSMLFMHEVDSLNVEDSGFFLFVPTRSLAVLPFRLKISL